MQAVSARRSIALHTRSLRRRLATDSLLRNSLFIMSTTIVNSLFGYLFWIVAARTHSAHDVGLAAALIAAVTLASILSGIGLADSLIQLLPGRAAGFAWSLTLNAGLAAGILSGVATGAIGLFVLQACSHQFAVLGHNGAYAVAFVAGVPLWTVTILLDHTFVAERAAGGMLARNATSAVLKNIFLLALLPLTALGALGIFGSSVLATICGAFAALGLLRRLGRDYRPALRGILRQTRLLASTSLGHHLATIGASGPTYLLPTLVTVRLSATDNAYFYTTWMVGGIFFMISPSVASSLFAQGAHAAHRLDGQARASLRIIGALLGPVMLVFLLGGRLILAVFGSGYARHGAMLLTLLVVSAVPDAITNVYVATQRVRGRLRRAALLNLGMAALTLALAWLLLPPWGIAGAGAAWLIAQTAGSVAVGLQMLVEHTGRRRRDPAGAPPGDQSLPSDADLIAAPTAWDG